MDTALTERLGLAYAAYSLKDEPRAGWVMHGVARPETVAAHSWGTAYLCLLFASDAGVDPGRALAIAVLHDLAEATTGDFAARAAAADRPVPEAEKARLEREAIAGLLPAPYPELLDHWRAYEERADATARFVRDMNLVDMCLEALRYERGERYDASVPVPSQGGHRHLDEFFASAERRLEGDLAKRLFREIKAEYGKARSARRGPGGPA